MARRKKTAKPGSRKAIFELVRRATVAFATIEDFPDRQVSQQPTAVQTPKVIGSGFALRGGPGGMIITAKHVVETPHRPLFAFIPQPVRRESSGQGEERIADYSLIPISRFTVTIHNSHDVALLADRQLTLDPSRSLVVDYAATPYVGQEIALSGWPYGLMLHQTQGGSIPTSSALTGIISAIYPHPSAVATARSLYVAQLPTSPGHSGGPVFNPRTGKVFGVQSSRVETTIHPDGNKAVGIKMPVGLSNVVPVTTMKEAVLEYKKRN